MLKIWHTISGEQKQQTTMLTRLTSRVMRNRQLSKTKTQLSQGLTRYGGTSINPTSRQKTTMLTSLTSRVMRNRQLSKTKTQLSQGLTRYGGTSINPTSRQLLHRLKITAKLVNILSIVNENNKLSKEHKNIYIDKPRYACITINGNSVDISRRKKKSKQTKKPPHLLLLKVEIKIQACVHHLTFTFIRTSIKIFFLFSVMNEFNV